MYSVSRILHASDSGAWKKSSGRLWKRTLLTTSCPTAYYLPRSYFHPRFFWENGSKIVSRSAGQYSAHIVVRKKNYCRLRKVNCVLCEKNMVCIFCADESPQTQCIFLTRAFFVHQLISSLTIKSNYYGKSSRLGTRNRLMKNGNVINYKYHIFHEFSKDSIFSRSTSELCESTLSNDIKHVLLTFHQP